MPRGERARDLDARALQAEGPVNVVTELAYLRAGCDPPWERPHLNGTDITDQPHLWTPYQRARRESYEARVRQYRAGSLL